MRVVTGVAMAGVVLALAGRAPAVAQADVRSEILRLDAEWLQAAHARDVDRAVSYWAEDAIVYPPGSAPLSGKAAIRDYVVKSFQTPGFSISWKTDTVTVTTGTNRVTFNTPDGKAVTIDGKAVVVWRRQKDGAWKCAVDIWNDAPTSR
jgi:ketosteroid isomerase-like protein